MYIYRKDDGSDIYDEVASFGGWKNNDPLSRFKSGGNGDITSISAPSSNNSLTASAQMDILPNIHDYPS